MIEARPTPPPRGVWALDILERPFLALERLGRRLLPFELDPIANMGALANLTFIIAAITGTLLLFWYVPSVRQAYHSLKALEESALVGQLVRSLHRYSSDACMFFVLLHALRYFFGRRFAGPRWLAWLTGVASLGLIWFVGWTGYWLVWDERARQVALGTAKMMDVVPIFNESLSRSFLVDGDVNTFLFFVVFFGHMLIPLLVGIGLWLHITRLSRPRFLPSRALGLWTLASLALMGLLWPATSVEPAHMGVNPEGFTMDWWYLLPLTLTDRLSAGALWLSFFASGTIVLFLPWIARRGHPVPAEVQPSKCNDCRKCAADCPYGAIEMRPREDTSRYERVATIDPSKCVGCGICAGSCDSAGIGVPWMAAPSARTRLDGWIEAAKAAGERPRVAFVCACSAGAALSIDPETGHSPGLPGYLVWAVPCAGWVHPLTVERAIRHGAEGVLIVSSAPGGCSFREGGVWTDLRMRGERLPELRADQVDPARVRILHLDRAQGKALRAQASAFTASDPPPGAPQPD
ncbi:MAG: cytochrome b N-terminal domain-containing protein, partial [Myxococcales bacterium]|nr:cytochrome b N-terminal domain-containing protein [Myxococcales bacterium]